MHRGGVVTDSGSRIVVQVWGLRFRVFRAREACCKRVLGLRVGRIGGTGVGRLGGET